MEKDCQARKSNKEDAMDHSRWRQLTKDVWWSVWVWVGECYLNVYVCNVKTHTHTHLMAFFPGLPRCAGTRKVKPIWILLKQETVSGSGISWAICKSAPCYRQITMPAPHWSVFLQAGCPSCHPTNSVKALKVTTENSEEERKSGRRGMSLA